MAQATEGKDWPTQITDRVVDLVDQVRSKTTDPAITVARGIVFGLLAAVLGVVLLVLLLVFAFRILDVYLPWDTWAAYVIYGGIFTLLGAFLWSRRTA